MTLDLQSVVVRPWTTNWVPQDGDLEERVIPICRPRVVEWIEKGKKDIYTSTSMKTGINVAAMKPPMQISTQNILFLVSFANSNFRLDKHPPPEIDEQPFLLMAFIARPRFGR